MKTNTNSKSVAKVSNNEGEKKMKDVKNSKPVAKVENLNDGKIHRKPETKKPVAPAKVAPKAPATKSAPVAKVPAKVAQKAETPAKSEKGCKIKDLLAFCEPLFVKGIPEGELMQKLAAKFPETAVPTFKTQVYKCRNLKYTKLEKLVVKGKDGVLKFA